MSHFSVMVIGDNIEEQLHPFDENRDDILTDKTEEVREAADEKIKVIKVDGKYEMVYGDRAEQPDVLEVTKFEYYGNDLDKLAEDWFGYTVGEDGTYWSSYNPNSKWDWWVVGGRWRNMLLHVDNPKYPEKIAKGDMGVPELMHVREHGASPEPANHCDAAALCDIDWEAMAEANRADAVARWEHFMEQNPDLKPGMDREALKAYTDGGGTIKDSMYLWCRESIPTKQEVENEAYALTTYALVKDGEWYEKGEMGWFGISTNEKSCAEWQEIFEKVIDGIPEDTTITILDCHI
jgi:hypothetical protein